MAIISDYYELWVIVLMGITTIAIITFIIMTVRYSGLRRSYIKMLKGNGSANLEEVINQIHDQITTIQSQLAGLEQRVEHQEQQKKHMKSNIAVKRYNAYDQQGSDLSFSIAIVDDYKSGAVLTGLHSREQTFLYAKALNEGSSEYQLSPEEKAAINQAVNKEKA